MTEVHSINRFIVPVDADIEDYQRDYGDPDVEDGVHPEQVDIQIPEVVPTKNVKLFVIVPGFMTSYL